MDGSFYVFLGITVMISIFLAYYTAKNDINVPFV
jgi:hypothetical protein